MIYKHFILWIGILMASCQSKQGELVFQSLIVQDTLYLEGTILCDSLLMNAVEDIGYNDSCVIVSAYSEEHFLHCYDRQTGKPLRHLLVQGRGPGELLAMSTFKFTKDSVLSCFDPIATKRHEYVMDSLWKGEEYTGKEYFMKNTLRNVIPLGDVFLSGMK